jgi:NADPH:quinone reductase
MIGMPMPPAPPTDDHPVQARCVRLTAKADNVEAVAPVVETHVLSRGANDLLIAVRAAAVNPSDAKAATGLMPYALFLRTPGRDFAGVVIDGPAVAGSSRDRVILRP